MPKYAEQTSVQTCFPVMDLNQFKNTRDWEKIAAYVCVIGFYFIFFLPPSVIIFTVISSRMVSGFVGGEQTAADVITTAAMFLVIMLP